MRFLRHLLRAPEAGGDAGGADGGAGAAGDAGAGGAAGAADPGAAGGQGEAAGAGDAGAGDEGGAAGGKSGGDAGAGDSGKKPEDAKPSWRDDWRETMAKGDAKVLARLQRYASPEALSDAFISAEKRLTSGDLKPILKKDATAEQLAEYRAAHGIPEKADGYDIGKDAKLSEQGKAFLERYLPIAHAANMTPEQVKANLGFIAAMNKGDAEARALRDVEAEEAGEEVLRAEWGGEYKRNLTFIHNLLDGAATPAFKDKLLGARMPDGTAIGSDPEALRFLMGLALIQNPTGTLVPGYNNKPAEGVDEEIAKIENVMKTDRAAYNKDDKMQSRLRDLYEAREKLKSRA